MKFKLLWLMAIAIPAMAQVSNPSIISVTVAPSGACSSGLPNQQVVSTGVQYSCQGGTWASIGGGSGSGTVNAGLLGQTAYYGANGTAVSGIPSRLSFNVAAYGAKGDTQWSATATTVNSSATITCSGCAFVAGDVGKLVWVVNGSTLVVAQTTISTVNSSTSITVGTTATAGASNLLIVWGSDDTTALSNVWTAAKAVCGTVVLNAALYITQSPQFTSGYAGCSAVSNFYNQSAVVGRGKMNTFLVPSPNFNFAACGGDANSCFLGALYSLYKGFSIWGSSLSPSGCASKNLAANNGSFISDMDLSGWCASGAGSVGLLIVGQGPGTYFGGDELFGSTGILDTATNAAINNFVSSGNAVALDVKDTALISIDNLFGGPVIIEPGYRFDSYSDRITSTTSVGGIFNPHSDLITSGPVTLLSTGILHPYDTSFPSVSGYWLTYGPLGTLLDTSGGNTFNGGSFPIAPVFSQIWSSNSTGTSNAQPFQSNTTAGSVILLGVEWVQNSGQTSTGCTDTQTNSYTQSGSTLVTGTTYGSQRAFALYYSNGSKSSAADTVTCTFSASVTSSVLTLLEYTGQYKNSSQATSPFEGVYTNTGSGTTVNAGTTTSTSQLNELVGLIIQWNTGAGFTDTGMVVNTRFGNYVGVRDRAMAADGLYVGNYAITGTWSGNSDWAGYWFKMLPANYTGPLTYGSASIQGTQQTAANWSVPAGASAGQWGTSPSVGACSGSAVRQECTITVGSSVVGLNPVLTITQPISFIAVPSCAAQMVGGTAVLANFTNSSAPTLSTATFTYNGTPIASTTIDLVVTCSN